MRLGDRVTVQATTGTAEPGEFDTPAYVYWSASVEHSTELAGVQAVTTLRAILPSRLPRELSTTTDRILWRGDSYRIIGEPMARMRRGAVHHWTINLERISAG